MEQIDRKSVERAARIYATNGDAGTALGIAPGSFGRLCRRFGILTPQTRKQERREARRRRLSDSEQ
jgi:transposase-like protein